MKEQPRWVEHLRRPAFRSAAVVLCLVVAIVTIPWMTSGIDIYLHLVWAHQVMRTLAAGSLPLWLPDLNAGCGSPGIRLNSPGGPALTGALGLVTGDAASGMRLALGFAVLLLFFLYRSGRVERPGFALALTALAPPVLADLGIRGAWASLLGIPVAWWLLERAAVPSKRGARWQIEAAALAGLWLIHAPSAVMVGLLLGITALLDGRRRMLDLSVSGISAACLVAWHLLPLADEISLMGSRSAFVSGIFVARNNVLGAASAHAPAVNAGLSLAGIALLLVVLVEGWPRREPRRAFLVTLCVGLASPLSLPLWAGSSPLVWLQFPWRWLIPAVLLTIRPLALRTSFTNPRSWALGVLWLAPVAVLPLPPLIHAPHLTAREGWKAAGSRLNAAIGANPLLVDAPQDRPPWYDSLASQLPSLGDRRAIPDRPDARLETIRWRPLHRTFRITAPGPTKVTLRLLDYPWWQPTLDGAPARAIRERGLLAVTVPAGTHTLDLRWTGNPLSRAGQALAASALLLLAWTGSRRKTP